MADDRVAPGIALIEGTEKKFAGSGIGIVPPHVYFAADDIPLGIEVLCREGGEECEFKEDVKEDVG